MTGCPDHGDLCTKEEQSAKHNNNIKSAFIHYMENGIFNDKIDEHFSQYSTLRLRLTRGFTVGGEIFIRRSTRIALKTLIKHEFGHLFGYPHVISFTLMNPTWSLRWRLTPRIYLID